MAPLPTPEGPQPGPSRVFLLGLAVGLLALAVWLAWPFLGAIVLATVLGLLLQPLQRRLVRTLRLPSLAALLCTLLVALALVVPLAYIAFEVADEATLVIDRLQDRSSLERDLGRALAPLGLSKADAADLVAAAGERAANAIQSALVPTVATVFHVLGSLLVFFILLFFTLRDGPDLMGHVVRLTPLRPHARARLSRLVAQRTRAIVLGTFLVSVIQGVVAGIGWWFFGYPAPVFWGFVMTILGVLPFTGPFVVLIPAGVFSLMDGNLFQGIGILVYATVLVGVVDDLVRPYVVGKQAGVHPAIILVGTLGGLYVFGVSGFVLGPLLLSLLGPVLDVWAEERNGAGGSPESPPGLGEGSIPPAP